VLVLSGGFAAFWIPSQPSLNAGSLLALYLASGVLFFYLATMLFSPVNVKYIVPGSKLLRRW
jgi:hypothetical protein